MSVYSIMHLLNSAEQWIELFNNSLDATTIKANAELGLHYAWFLLLVEPGIPIGSHDCHLQWLPKFNDLSHKAIIFQTLAMILHNK